MYFLQSLKYFSQYVINTDDILSTGQLHKRAVIISPDNRWRHVHCWDQNRNETIFAKLKAVWVEVSLLKTILSHCFSCHSALQCHNIMALTGRSSCFGTPVSWRPRQFTCCDGEILNFCFDINLTFWHQLKSGSFFVWRLHLFKNPEGPNKMSKCSKFHVVLNGQIHTHIPMGQQNFLKMVNTRSSDLLLPKH